MEYQISLILLFDIYENWQGKVKKKIIIIIE